MIKIRHKGSFKNTERFFLQNSKDSSIDILDRYGQAGVSALASNTPKESGQTASSWGYTIEKTSAGYSLTWTNDNVNNGVNIAVILQYGHGTGTGGYVEGIDYINPALRPIFEQLANDAWREVTK